MKKPRPSKSLNIWYWPTELALRFPHCWTPNLLVTIPMPHKERRPGPRLSPPRGSCARPAKRLRYEFICRPLADLPF
jgi:hypothetical protein